MLSKNKVLKTLFDKHAEALSAYEGLSVEELEAGINAGTMVMLGNPNHPNLEPIMIGQPARVKVNANIGTSPLTHCLDSEKNKIKACVEVGADTIMDLSISGDLDSIRKTMIASWHKPIGTVPMYAVGQQILDKDMPISSMDPEMLFKEVEKQAEQGVDYMTLHCGITCKGAQFGDDTDPKYGRVMGIVSRGGSMLARWMLDNDKENPLLVNYDRLLEICLKHNVTISLGDALRPGGGDDAGDAAQIEEAITLGQLVRRSREAGVQTMIEGPGHVRMHQIASNIQIIKQLTYNAPIYVLGPLTMDSAAGHDHIAGAIGGALGVQAGVDFLCYLTPAEHLALPNVDDVMAGVIASKIAAQAGELALGRKHAVERENAMNKARKALDWDGMTKAALDPQAVIARRAPHKDEEVCAMCGKFCAVKMLNDRRKH